MELDSLRAEKEARADLFVRQAFRCRDGDLELLGRQLLMSRRLSRSQPLSARPQLGASPVGPRSRTESFERLKRRVQLLARAPASSQPP